LSRFVQRADARFVTRGAGWVGRYCFSYDEHYDPANVSFGPLVACNEFVLAPGAGFGTHRHAGVDVVSVVLEGVLTHVTPSGASRRPPGVYVFPTGAGAEHDERNDGQVPVRFVQAWVLPGAVDPRPSVLGPGAHRVDGPAFVFVTAGSVEVGPDVLEAGDSLRVVGEAVEVVLSGAALVWQL
jgi:mannose-6-phosphate isomerase-like protein (cupin superfamily)